MVLAIVLDVYNEVRSSTDAGDTIFFFLRQIAKRLRAGKQWVPDNDIACLYGDSNLDKDVKDTGSLNVNDLLDGVPNMTEMQRNILMNSCKMEMAWQSKQDLVTSNYLKLGASIKLS